jgi:hypothetical protein
LNENQNNKDIKENQPFNLNKELFSAAKTASTSQMRTVNTLRACYFDSKFTSQYLTQQCPLWI